MISRGRGHSLIMVLDENRNCYSNLNIFFRYDHKSIYPNVIFYPMKLLRE